jgi:hypothetical protein
MRIKLIWEVRAMSNPNNIPFSDDDKCSECGGQFGSAAYEEEIECIGGPQDGMKLDLSPPHVPFLISEPRSDDPEDLLGYGYQFESDPPRYVFVGIVKRDSDDADIGHLYYWTVEEEEADEGGPE